MFASATFLIFTATSFWRADVAPNADYWALALLQGAGIAMYFAPLIAITLGDLSPGQMAFGSGLVNFFRITAGSFGASLATTFWQRREAVHHTHLVEGITAYTPQAGQAMTQLGHAGLNSNQTLAQIDGMVTQQATLLAVNDMFWISGWLFMLLIASVWLAKKPVGSKSIATH